MWTHKLPIFICLVIFNSIWRVSGNFEGDVRLGMFFMSNGDGIMAKFALEVDL